MDSKTTLKSIQAKSCTCSTNEPSGRSEGGKTKILWNLRIAIYYMWILLYTFQHYILSYPTKTCLKEVKHEAFHCKNDNSYKFVILGFDSTNFTTARSKVSTQSNRWSVCQSFSLAIYLSLSNCHFSQQVIVIPISIHRPLLLTDRFLYSYELEFVQILMKDSRTKLKRQLTHLLHVLFFYFTYMTTVVIPFFFFFSMDK